MRAYFAFIQFIVSGSESGHSRLTRDAYNYDPRYNGSCGNLQL